MRIRKYKQGTPLCVFWLDTVEDPTWRSPEDSTCAGAIIRNYGEYIKHDKNYLYLASSLWKYYYDELIRE